MKLIRQIRVSEDELNLLTILRIYEIKPITVAKVLMPLVKNEELKQRLEELINRYEVIKM